MSDVDDPKVEKRLSRKEFLKEMRRKQYLLAKERYQNSDFAKEAKEKQKAYRKEQYQKAKESKKAYEAKRKVKAPSEPTQEGTKIVDPVSRRCPSDHSADEGINLVVSNPGQSEKSDRLWEKVKRGSEIASHLKLVTTDDSSDATD